LAHFGFSIVYSQPRVVSNDWSTSWISFFNVLISSLCINVTHKAHHGLDGKEGRHEKWCIKQGSGLTPELCQLWEVSRGSQFYLHYITESALKASFCYFLSGQTLAHREIIKTISRELYKTTLRPFLLIPCQVNLFFFFWNEKLPENNEVLSLENDTSPNFDCIVYHWVSQRKDIFHLIGQKIPAFARTDLCIWINS
jgi:hypothetical protein